MGEMVQWLVPRTANREVSGSSLTLGPGQFDYVQG